MDEVNHRSNILRNFSNSRSVVFFSFWIMFQHLLQPESFASQKNKFSSLSPCSSSSPSSSSSSLSFLQYHLPHNPVRYRIGILWKLQVHFAMHLNERYYTRFCNASKHYQISRVTNFISLHFGSNYFMFICSYYQSKFFVHFGT